tara:strand:+ start:125 stop:346 length:222 start_codon:yes stop_codon:yes gene_type:complete
MKVGDLVRRKISNLEKNSRKKIFKTPEEEPAGIIMEVRKIIHKDKSSENLVIINYNGKVHTFPEYLLELISEA